VTAIISLGLVALAVNVALYPQTHLPNAAAVVNMDALRVIVGLALLAATLGFVPFNFNPASIFMGDAGSLFLGFSCALMIVMLGEAEARWLLAAMVMFSLPVLDTALAFARRKLAGRPLFSADKQHLHHQLVARGMSVKQAVLVAYGLAIFFVICGIAIVYIRTRYAVGFYLVLFGSIIVAAYKMGMIHERVAKAPKAEMGGTGLVPGVDAIEPEIAKSE
jgi:UDP-GlcNAc:undecaprenyl-phosphate GlcNAc-1-phosphate transferase